MMLVSHAILQYSAMKSSMPTGENRRSPCAIIICTIAVECQTYAMGVKPHTVDRV